MRFTLARLEQLIGPEYKGLRDRLSKAAEYRNKIFHGQLTANHLSRPELLTFVEQIRSWCNAFGCGALGEVGYDGCGRNSFRKAKSSNMLCSTYKMQLADVAAYRRFIKTHMERAAK